MTLLWSYERLVNAEIAVAALRKIGIVAKTHIPTFNVYLQEDESPRFYSTDYLVGVCRGVAFAMKDVST